MAPPSKRQANLPSSTSSPNAVLPLPGLAIGVIAGIAAAIASHNLLRKKEKKKKKKKEEEDVPSPSLLLEETQIITCKKDEDEEEEEEEKEDGFSEKPLLSSVNELDFRLAYGEDLHLSIQDSSISSSDTSLISSNEGTLHEVSNDLLKPFPSEFYEIKSDNLSLNEREREREREYLNWAQTDKKHVSHIDLHPLLATQSIELRRISTSNIETEIDLKHDNVGNTSCFWIKDSNPQLLIDGSKIGHMDMNNQHSSLELLIDGSETGHMNVSDEENSHARRIYDDICLNHKYDQPKSQLRPEESNDTGSITNIPSFNDTCLRKHVETNQQFFTWSFDNGIQQSNFQPTLERSDNGSEKLDLQSTMEGSSNGSKNINVEPGLDNGSNTQPAMQGSDDVSENHNLQPAMEGFVNHIEKPNLHLTIEKLDDDSKYHNLQSIKEKSDEDSEKPNLQSVKGKSDNDSENPTLQPTTEESANSIEQLTMEKLDNGSENPNLQPTIERFDNGTEKSNLQPTMDNGIEKFNLQPASEEQSDNGIEKFNLQPASEEQSDNGIENPKLQAVMERSDNGSQNPDPQPPMDGSDNDIEKPKLQPILKRSDYRSEKPSLERTMDNGIGEPNLQPTIAELDNGSENLNLKPEMEESDNGTENLNLTSSWEDVNDPCLLCAELYPVLQSAVDTPCVDRGISIQSITNGFDEAHSSIDREPNLQSMALGSDEPWSIDTHDTSLRCVNGCSSTLRMPYETFANEQPNIRSIEAKLDDNSLGVDGQEVKLQSIVEFNDANLTDNGEHDQPLIMEGSEYTLSDTIMKLDAGSTIKGNGDTLLLFDKEISVKSTMAKCLENISQEQEVKLNLQFEVEEYVGKVHAETTKKVTADPCLCADHHPNFQLAIEFFDDTCNLEANPPSGDDPNLQLAMESFHVTCTNVEANLPLPVDGPNGTCISINEKNALLLATKNSGNTGSCVNDDISIIFGRDSNLQTTLEGSDDTSSISTSEQLPGIKVYEKIVSTDEREQKMESLIEGSGFGRDSNLLTTLEGSDDTSSISTSEQLPGIKGYENIVSTDEREQKMESVIEGSDDADLSAESVDNVEHSNQSREVSEKCCSFLDEAHDDLQSIKECSEDTVLSKDIEPNLKSNFAGNNFIQTNEHVNLESIMEQFGSIFPISLPHLQPIVKESEKICSSIDVEHDFRETMEGWNKLNGEPDIQLIGEHVDYTCLSKCEEPDDQSTMEGVSNLPIYLGIDGESIFLSVLMESDSAGEPKSGSGETGLTSDTEPNAQLKMEESDDGDDHLTSIGVPNIHPMMKGSDPTFANQNVDGEIYFETIVEHGNNNYLTSNGYYNCQLLEGLDTCAERAVEKYDGTNSDMHGKLSLLPMGGETCFGTNFISMVVQEESDSLSIDGMPNNQSILEGYDYMCLSGDGDHILQPKIEVSDDINECCLSGDDECNHKITREGSNKSCLSSDGNPDLHLIENFSDYRTMGWSCNISENSQSETCLSVDRETPLQSTMIPGDNTCLSYNEYPYIQSKREECGHTCAGRVHNLPSTLDDSLDIDGESSVERSDNANLQLIASFDEICQTSDRELNVQSEMDESADATPVRSGISNGHSFMKDSATIFSIIGEETHSKLIVEVGNDTWLTSSGYDKLPKLVKHLDVCSSNESNVHTTLEECNKTCFCINDKSNLLSNVAIEESDMAYFTPIDGVSKCQSLLETNDDCLTANGDSTIQPIVEFSDDVDNMHLSDGVVTDDNVPLISNHGQLIINDADPNPQSAMETGGSPYTHTTINDKYDDLLIMDRSNDTCSVSDELQCSREGFEISCLRADGEQDLRSATESVSNTSVSIVDEKLHLQSRIKNTDQHHMLKSTIEVDESDEMCLRIEREPDFQYKFNTRSDQSRLMSTDEIAPNDEDASNDKDEILGHTIIAPLKEHNVVKDTIIDPVKDHGDCPLMDHSEEHIVKSRSIDINDVKEPVCNDVIEKRKFGLNGTEKKPSHANSSGVLSHEQGLSSVKKEDGELRSSDGNGDMKIKEAPPSIHTSKKSKRRRKVKKDKAVVRGTDYRQEVLIVHQSKDGWFPNKFEKLAPHFVLCFVAACLFIVVVSIVQQFLQLSQPLG